MSESRRAMGPGRVNLIGDHTDYNQGLALPMAVGLGVTVTFRPGGGRSLSVTSSSFAGSADVPVGLPPEADLSALEPAWSRLVAAVASGCGLRTGGTLTMASTLPVGAGLSSSAAVGVALAEVFGAAGPPEDVARLVQGAEHRIGVPVGLMDPLACAGGRAGHALLIAFDTLSVEAVPIPEDVEIVVIDSGERRTLRTSAYAARVAECRAAARVVGVLGRCREDELEALRDPVLRSRARHVVTECARVRAVAEALARDDLPTAGALLSESHRSLARDFAVSTPVLDDLVAEVASRPGVLGARMTGAGFGGCVVALARPGAVDTDRWPTPSWRVVPSDGTVAARGTS